MVEWLTYGLQIEIVIIGLFVYSLAVLLRAIRNISEEFQFAIILILLSLIMEILQGTMSRVLVVRDLAKNSPLWLISPFIGLAGAFFLVLGSKKFLSESEKTPE